MTKIPPMRNDPSSDSHMIREEGSVRLPDGRTLCYAEFGDKDGIPTMLFHGAPGYRLFWTALPEYPFLPGLRFIAPDRPGYGRSDFKPAMTYADWPDDVTVLADALSLDQFAVVGVSGGGPGTLACAWRIPERLCHVAIVSSVGPPVPDILEAISPINRKAYHIARRAPWLMRLNMRLLASLQRRDIDGYLDKMTGKLSAADQTALARSYVRDALRAAMSLAATPPGAKGYAQDVINQARPWPFPLGDISLDVEVWQPEDDTSVPPVVGRYLSRNLPNTRVRFIPGAGHLWHIEHLTTVLRSIIESPASARSSQTQTRR